ncbi:hypothetical protein M427DRAFT_58558 [Gonapodya prolifera JEL478]|uniref:Uncharacterized protein n=1 Tax=Gonapodya prolifera (strain JEL478) TaxID=1344416 RepID=A0A139AA21_GONPJ|nr:hypothetical protein M427DRAFT_58558 [Gonapodya prolifera JEL478]|eukprot:KXS13504.1 hypothetical protein M427DRAFT_58558 [Gonapodya prolifera JEL478]
MAAKWTLAALGLVLLATPAHSQLPMDYPCTVYGVSDFCVSFTRCNGGKCTLIDSLPAGRNCNSDAVCAGINNRCLSGTCTLIDIQFNATDGTGLTLGSNCSTSAINRDPCADNLVCSNGTCAIYDVQPIGGRCASRYECIGGSVYTTCNSTHQCQYVGFAAPNATGYGGLGEGASCGSGLTCGLNLICDLGRCTIMDSLPLGSVCQTDFVCQSINGRCVNNTCTNVPYQVNASTGLTVGSTCNVTYAPLNVNDPCAALTTCDNGKCVLLDSLPKGSPCEDSGVCIGVNVYCTNGTCTEDLRRDNVPSTTVGPNTALIGATQAASASSQTQSQTGSGGGSSAGSTVGIVFGVLAALAIVAGAAVWYRRRRKSNASYLETRSPHSVYELTSPFQVR